MKLAILDKDGTLTGSASGATFPQHPQDQTLLSGVEDAVARLVADGYTLVIASNQGGCEVFSVDVSAAKAGMVWLDSSTWFSSDSKPIKLDSVFQHDTGAVELSGWSDLGNGQRLYSGSRMLDKGTRIKCCWKTIEEAIAEMQYCMELLPAIEAAYFCPDFAGRKLRTCYSLKQNWQVVFSTADKATNFRKPGDGMIKQAIANFSTMFEPLEAIIFIGDRAEDNLAAQTAGIPFLDAEAWRNGAVISHQ